MGGRQVAIREILGLNLNRELCLKNYIIHMPKKYYVNRKSILRLLILGQLYSQLLFLSCCHQYLSEFLTSRLPGGTQDKFE